MNLPPAARINTETTTVNQTPTPEPDPVPQRVRAVRTSDVSVQDCQSALKLDPNRRAKLTPLSGTAEVVPVVNRGDPRGFV